MHELLKISITTSVFPYYNTATKHKKSQSPLSSGIFRPQVGVLLAEKYADFLGIISAFRDIGACSNTSCHKIYTSHIKLTHITCV